MYKHKIWLYIILISLLILNTSLLQGLSVLTPVNLNSFIQQSDLIIKGSVVSKDNIYIKRVPFVKYVFIVKEVILNNGPQLINQNNHIFIIIPGLLDNTKTKLITIVDGLPYFEEKKDYLLFLKQTPDSNIYRLNYASFGCLEIENKEVIPCVQNFTNPLLFNEHLNISYTELINKINDNRN